MIIRSTIVLVGFLMSMCTETSVAQSDLLTVAERSGYRATARHAEVVDLLDRLAAASPLARRASMGRSGEGRDLPMLIMSDPPVTSPSEARRASKPVILMIGNIHAGEVDGKEGLPMMARDLLRGQTENEAAILRQFVVIIAPIYNADGNERVSPSNRPGQAGPEEGMGIRENADGLDLNRDFVKLEASETRALVSALNEWDPLIFVDTHTTNGSHHRHLITYAGPKHPGGDPAIISFSRNEMFPALDAAMKAKGVSTFWYGNFEDSHTRWSTYPCTPRYGVNYLGLRNRISILSEAYSYAPYRDRVEATRDFCRAILDVAVANKEKIVTLCSTADAAQAELTGQDIALRTRAVAFSDRATALGFVEEPGVKATEQQEKDYQVLLEDQFEPTLVTQRPYAYLYSARWNHITAVLQRHGVRVEELREDVELDVETLRIDTVTPAMLEFQGHRIVSVQTSARREPFKATAGMMVVRTTQPLGSLVVQLLEPSAEDGLTAWNFFDDALVVNGDFPVMRVAAQYPLLLRSARRLTGDSARQASPITFAAYESDAVPNIGGMASSGGRWLRDESTDAYLTQREGTVWRVDAATGRAEPFCNATALAASLATLSGMDDRAAKSIASNPPNLSKDADAFFFERYGDLYYAKVDGSESRRLTDTTSREDLAEFSPDASRIAFVRDYDLFVVDVHTGAETMLTNDGPDDGLGIRNGINTWVYFEEVFNRDWKAFWWSPDSRSIAFFRTDPAPVPTFTIIDHNPKDVVVEHAAFPKPGEPNPIVRLGIAPTQSGAMPAISWLDLGGYEPTDTLLTGVFFTPDSTHVGAYVQNRVQTWLDVLLAPISAGESTLPRQVLFRETTQAWVEPPQTPEFLDDGTFLFFSERSGFKHLYRYRVDGMLLNQVTGAHDGGTWECRGLQRIDPDGQWVYFNGTADSHIAQNLYRVHPDGTGHERLTIPLGDHGVSVSPSCRYFFDTTSSLHRTASTALRSTGDGRVVRTIDSNPVYELEDVILGDTEQVQVPTRDGFPMEAIIIKPTNFDPAKKYPVWLTTYAGPSAPTVRDTWGGGRVWERVIAEAGVVVFNVDPRPASGKGVIQAWTAYKQLGVQELKDLEDAVDWLCRRPYIDSARVGLAGHSYGGFITAYALTHSTKFRAGISGAPVTDWSDYDSIYTERYMLTPQENPDGYAKTSCTGAAANLHGRLLLIHGTMDDNVHMQNSIRLVSALQRASQQFDFMMYPGSRHGIGGKHYRRFMYDFIVKNLVDAP